MLGTVARTFSGVFAFGRRRNRRTTAGLLGLALIGSLVGTGLADSASAEPVVIRLGYPGVGAENRPFTYGGIASIVHTDQYIEKEFANDPDIKVEWTLFRGAGPALNEAVASGQLDFAAGLGDLPAIVGRANGLKTKWLAISDVHNPIVLAVKPGSGIKTVDDLRGRRISQFKGTNVQLAADRVLEAHGLTEKNIRFVNLDFANAVSALVGGSIDGSFATVEALDLKRRGIVEVPYTTKGEDPKFSRATGLLVTEEFEAKHPELVQRVVNAYVKAAKWGADEANREALLALYAKSGLAVEALREWFDGELLEYRLNPLIDDYVLARYRDQAERALQYGLLRKPVEIDGWVETKYLDRALAEQNLQNRWKRSDANGVVVSASTTAEAEKAR